MYKLIKNEFGEVSAVKDLEKKKYIPMNEANTDYQEYLEWLAEGGQVEEAD